MKKITTVCSLVLLSSSFASAQEKLSIGIIVPSKDSFKKEILQSQAELKEVLDTNYDIQSNIVEYSNLEELKSISKELAKKNEVILSLDPISSKFLDKTTKDSKVLAPFANVSTMTTEGAKLFKELYSFDKLTFLTSKEVEASEIIENIEKELNVDVTLTYIEDIATTVNKDAILIYNPARRNENEVSKFVRDNLDGGIPSFSIMSKDYVDGGALAGVLFGKSTNRVLRESVLDLEETLLSEEYLHIDEDEETSYEDKLLFNLSSSKKLGIYPNKGFLDQAIFVGSFLEGSNEIDFEKAIDIALDNNLTLKSTAYNLDAFSFNPERAKTLDKVNVDAFTTYVNQNEYFTENSPYNAENTLKGGVTASKNLFNDEINEQIFVQEKNYEAQKESYNRSEADTIFTAGASYLNVLSNEASLNIQNYNLELTREFLQIAQNRKDVGISDSSDVFRFESLFAQAQTTVRSNTGNLERSQRSLNQTLNLPLETKFKYTGMDITNPVFLTSNEDFLDILENPVKLDEFRRVFVEKTANSIPEVKSLGHLVEGKERELDTANRKRFTPTVGISATASWDLIDPQGENESDAKGKEDTWQLGLGFNLPLYEGGDIDLEKRQLSSELKSLESSKDATIEAFSRSISDKLTDLSVGYETIKNARISTFASEKNLELVKDNYAKGTVSITNLLDAQTDAVNSKENEVIATYSFLISLLDLERTIGTYYFNSNSQEKQEITNKINKINSRGGNL